MNEASDTPKGPNKFWVLLFFVLCGGFALITLGEQQGRRLEPTTWNNGWLAGAMLFQACFLAYATHLWKSFVSVTAKLAISHVESFNHLVAIAMGKYLPGKLWGLVARGTHFRRHGMNTLDYAQMSFLEQYLLLLACAVLALLSTPLFLPAPLSFAGVALSLPCIVAGFYFQDLAFTFYQRKFAPSQATYRKCNTVFRKLSPFTFLLLTGGYCLLWILNGTVLVALFAMTQVVSPDWMLAAKIVTCNAIAVSLGFLALFSPGGIGVREASIAAILGPSIGAVTAIQLAIHYRIFTIASELICGGITALTGWKKTS